MSDEERHGGPLNIEDMTDSDLEELRSTAVGRALLRDVERLRLELSCVSRNFVPRALFDSCANERDALRWVRGYWGVALRELLRAEVQVQAVSLFLALIQFLHLAGGCLPASGIRHRAPLTG